MLTSLSGHDLRPRRNDDSLPSQDKRKIPQFTMKICKNEKAPGRGRLSPRSCDPLSLDLGFAELDVLLGDRIVFLLDELVGHGARIFPRHIVEAGIGAGN